MSGHSKWSTIKRKKAKTDSQRSKFFSKVSREIMVAVKLGGDDPRSNSRLRLALHNAKNVNMPSDSIKRAIQKGLGKNNNANFEEIYYEAYAINGVAILIQTLTDNRNRTASNLRTILSKMNSTLAEQGSVAYLFERKSYFLIENINEKSTENILSIAVENNLENIDIRDDDSIEILTSTDDFEKIKLLFEETSLDVHSEISMIPNIVTSLNQNEEESLLALVEKLEDDEDVQYVFTNAI